MFNSYSNTCKPSQTQSIKINAVTGAILKNHPKSWFERFHLQSPKADKLLTRGGHRATRKVYNKQYGFDVNEDIPDEDIIVLQMVICGDMEVMAELVYRKDYEEKGGAE